MKFLHDSIPKSCMDYLGQVGQAYKIQSLGGFNINQLKKHHSDQACKRYLNSSNVAKALFSGSKQILIKKSHIISLTFYSMTESVH